MVCLSNSFHNMIRPICNVLVGFSTDGEIFIGVFWKWDSKFHLKTMWLNDHQLQLLCWESGQEEQCILTLPIVFITIIMPPPTPSALPFLSVIPQFYQDKTTGIMSKSEFQNTCKASRDFNQVILFPGQIFVWQWSVHHLIYRINQR